MKKRVLSLLTALLLLAGLTPLSAAAVYADADEDGQSYDSGQNAIDDLPETQEPPVTSWELIDEQGILDFSVTPAVLALPGANAWNIASVDTVRSMLPTQIKVTSAKGETILDILEWTCENYPEDGAYDGEYVFSAVLPGGYTLAENTVIPSVKVELGGAELYMSIYVDMPSGVEAFETGPIESVQHMKSMIQDRAGYPAEQQHLIFDGKVLDDSRTLQDYNVQRGDVLKLVLHNSSENGICVCGAYAEPEIADGVYQIKNAGNLFWFAAKVNSAGGADPLNAILVNNIDLNNLAWTPIGSSSNPYTGTFDGNGREIQNLKVDSAADNTGLFGYLSGATIKNVTVRGEVASTASKTGGLFGYAGSSTVMNCINHAAIKGGTTYNGGIGGMAENTNISNCTNYGSITSGVYENGGILGQLNGGTVEQCFNNGTISVADHAGGIVGWIDSGTVKNCGNTAAVSNTYDYYTYVGGIAGECRGTIQNCFNTGEITGSAGTGCYQAAIAGHYAFAGSGHTNYSNQHYGNGDSGTVKDNSAFASGEVAWLLNGGNAGGVWRQTLTGSEAQSTPNFYGDKVYKSSSGFVNSCDHIGSTNIPTCADSAVCSICGETLSATGLHIYDREAANAAFLKTPADCTNGAVYYKSCFCGASSAGTADEATFTSGDANGHNYSTAWSKDAGGHWHECSSCGYKKDLAAHTKKTVNAKEATTAEEGYTGDTVCGVCGYEIAKGEDIQKKPAPVKSDVENSATPKTGDNGSVFLWAALLTASAFGAAGTVCFGRKRKADG